MARNVNIVSFEDVKRSRRASVRAESAASRAGERMTTRRSTGSPRRVSRSVSSERPNRSAQVFRSGRTHAEPGREQSRESRTTFPFRFARQADEPGREQFDSLDREDARETARGTRDAHSTRDARRRQRSKAKAGRMFTRQFGSDDASAASTRREEGAPRAALYETKMGAKHRKSARMQRASSAGSVSAKVNPIGWFTSLPVTARALKLGTAALCVVLACAFLYAPARQYYQAQRELDRLTVEQSVIESRNDALDVQNDILASDAGMEDAVRQKYGYVKAGETAAAVTGLSESATDTSRNSANIEANVLSSSVRAPEEWYTPILDTFFGVE